MFGSMSNHVDTYYVLIQNGSSITLAGLSINMHASIQSFGLLQPTSLCFQNKLAMDASGSYLLMAKNQSCCEKENNIEPIDVSI